MPTLNKIPVPAADGVVFIDPLHVLYLRANDSYTHFFLTDKTNIVSSKNLGYYEKILNEEFFFRVHNSFIVNLQYITKYVKGDEAYVHLQGNIAIQIARGKKDSFLEKIGLKSKI